MARKSENRFTLKIIFSYLTLGALGILAAFFIYTEFKSYTASQDKNEDNLKLLKTNRLLTGLYEAENLSKLALQTKSTKNLKVYTQKVDSINTLIDSLKPMVSARNVKQVSKLDSVQKLLQQKMYNSAELRKLKVENKNTAPIDSILRAFHKMEVDMGRITPETFAPNFDQLSPATQKSIKEYVAILNKNIPDPNGNTDAKNIDSILEVSKSILQKAKTETAASERSVSQKELQIYRTDLELSQKMRSIISSFEREIIQNTYLDNLKQKRVLQRSIRLAAAAIALGLLGIILFTFFISKDFWKVQQYRDRLEEEKKYSESLLKSREQLISTVSHDLRTPLNTISGYTELMEQSGLNKKQSKYLGNMKSASNYVENLANDLLDFSKLEAGKVHIEKVPFVLFDLIVETTSHFQETQSKKGVELHLDIAEELKNPIIGDAFRVRQILTNLVGNAFKFTHSGYVKVEAGTKKSKDNSYLTIRVTDTGIGIEPRKQEIIFKEFAQAEDTTEKHYGGYGLGLTISKKLTELLGGTLTLASKKSEGSTFTLQLPFEFLKEPLTQAAENFTYQEGLTVYILDDDETLLELLREICQRNHIHVKTFLSYHDLARTENPNYDLLLTDIQMPDTDGFAVLQKLQERDDHLYSGQPIIAMTGQKIVDKKIYTKAGFTNVLQKPFSSHVLLKAVGAVSKINLESPIPLSRTDTIPESHSPLFRIAQISAFLDSPNAVREVLEVFMENTQKNLELLFSAIGDVDFSRIRSISHKMLPMFRQLEAQEAIDILERLEHLPDETHGKKVFETLSDLKTSIDQLEKAICQYLTTLPFGTD
ncbi:response regulator [Flagellimonas olearia]|uniref:histidine kinase n=1 Tax=Flagellimonas olearia TaxID=552546 RepID=A0A6I1DVP1_9FLAO|nr:hybrid sensor histidine kinase/response regulator [Allomuricauda olearia]KAB7528359.1 response regulator [Allomuricauda olearia]